MIEVTGRGVHVKGPATPRSEDWYWRFSLGGFSTLGRTYLGADAPEKPYVYGASRPELRPVVPPRC